MDTCFIAVPPRRFDPIIEIVCWPGASFSVKCRKLPSGAMFGTDCPLIIRAAPGSVRPPNFPRLSNNLRGGYLQDHFLGLALRDEREFENCTDFAGLLLAIRGGDAPKIVTGVQARHVYARTFGWRFFYRLGEHGSSADSQCVGYRLLH